jgi:hypothetical protein
LCHAQPFKAQKNRDWSTACYLEYLSHTQTIELPEEKIEDYAIQFLAEKGGRGLLIRIQFSHTA